MAMKIVDCNLTVTSPEHHISPKVSAMLGKRSVLTVGHDWVGTVNRWELCKLFAFHHINIMKTKVGLIKNSEE